MRYPQRLLTDDEDVVVELRPHWRVLLPALGWAMLLAAAVGVAFAALPPDLAWWSPPAAVALWALLSVRALLERRFTTYVLTTERVIVRRGVLSRRGHEIPLESIVNVRTDRSLWERLLGYGDVTLESAAAQGSSVLQDVPDPEAFQAEVYRLREARALALRHGVARPPRSEVIDELERLASLRERGHLSQEEFEQAKHRLLGG